MSLRSFSSSHRSRPFRDVGFGRDCFGVPDEEGEVSEEHLQKQPPPPVFLFDADIVQGHHEASPTEKIVLRNSWGQYEESLKARSVRITTQQRRKSSDSDRKLQQAGTRARFDSVDVVEDHQIFDNQYQHHTNNNSRNILSDGGERGLSSSPDALQSSSSLNNEHGKHNKMRVVRSDAVPHVLLGCSLSPSPSSPHGPHHHHHDEEGDSGGRRVSNTLLLVSGGPTKSTAISGSPTTCNINISGRVGAQSSSSAAGGLSISKSLLSSSDDANSVEGGRSSQKGREGQGQPRFGDDVLRFHDDPPQPTTTGGSATMSGGGGGAQGMRANEIDSPPFPSFWRETTKDGVSSNASGDALERPKSQRYQKEQEIERMVEAPTHLECHKVNREQLQEEVCEPRALGSPFSAFWERRRQAVLMPSAGGFETAATRTSMKSSSDGSRARDDTGVGAHATPMMATTAADVGMGSIEEVTRGHSEARTSSSSLSSATRIDSDLRETASEKDQQHRDQYQLQALTSLITQLGAEDDWLVLEMSLPIVLQHYTILAHERDRILERLNLLKERATEVGAGLGVPYEAPGDETNPPRLAFAPLAKDGESAKENNSKVSKGNSCSNKAASEEGLPSISSSKLPQDHIDLLPGEDLDASIFLVPPTPLPSRKQRSVESQPRQDQQQHQHKPSSVPEEEEKEESGGQSAPVPYNCLSPPPPFSSFKRHAYDSTAENKASSYSSFNKNGKDNKAPVASDDKKNISNKGASEAKTIKVKARSHSEGEEASSLALRAPSFSIFAVYGGDEEKRQDYDREQRGSDLADNDDATFILPSPSYTSSRLSDGDLRGGELHQRENYQTVADHHAPQMTKTGRWLPQSEKERKSEARRSASEINSNNGGSVQFVPFRSSSEPIATTAATKATKAVTMTTAPRSTTHAFQRPTNTNGAAITVTPNTGKERLPFCTSSSSQKSSTTSTTSACGLTSSSSCSDLHQNNRRGGSVQSVAFVPFGGRGREQNERALPHNRAEEENKGTLAGSRLDSRRLVFARHADPHTTHEQASGGPSRDTKAGSVPPERSQSQHSKPPIPLSEFLLKRQGSTNATAPMSTLVATPFTGGGGTSSTNLPTAHLQHNRREQSSSSLCHSQGSITQERLSKQNKGDALSYTYGHGHTKDSTSRNTTNRSMISVDGEWNKTGGREIPLRADDSGGEAFKKSIGARVTCHDSGNRGPNVRFGDLPIDLPVEEVLNRHYRGWDQQDY